jgi:hypothetical protein
MTEARSGSSNRGFNAFDALWVGRKSGTRDAPAINSQIQTRIRTYIYVETDARPLFRLAAP